MDELLPRLLAGERLATARAMSLVEDGAPGAERLLRAIFARTGGAHRVGITGPPGAGKSTLTEALVLDARARGLSVDVIAVDPTSPFTGGALLGDRIRMSAVAGDPRVFIRSMASRGRVGGLAATSIELADLLDAQGRELILLETVGVGQSELEVAQAADTTLVVLTPESGDGVQTMKAGLLEVGDVFVLNKADRGGAERLARSLESTLSWRVSPADGWLPPVVLATATRKQGVADVAEALRRHLEHLRASGRWAAARRERWGARVRAIVERQVARRLWQNGEAARVLRAMAPPDDSASLRSPYEAADALLAAAGFSREPAGAR
ncbi:MAG: methylmalonyl Co-A mutase-associated GTPase MeaB [Gemmatimonadota bacterium]